jgi:queuine/archaeosine tRNA-ribosyltransferase
MEILKGIEKGVDIFDSRMPTQMQDMDSFHIRRKIKNLNKKYNI